MMSNTPIKIPGARPLHKSKLAASSNKRRAVPPQISGTLPHEKAPHRGEPELNGNTFAQNGNATAASNAKAAPSADPWPLEAMEPKVWVPFENPPSGVPRRIVIERKRRDYLSKDIEQILRENGIDYASVESARRFESYLPLETFDDTEYDPRTPQEWMSLSVDSDGSQKCVPAVGFFFDQDTKTGLWKDCRVIDCNVDENSWLVESDVNVSSTPTEDDNDEQIHTTTEQQWLPRISLMFKAENPEVFAERVIKAHRARKEAESLLRYNLYIDSMPADEILPIDSTRVQKIKSMSLNTPNLEEHEDQLSVEQLLDEANIAYTRTMNKIIFDTNMKNSNQQELFSFLSLPPDEEERIVPWSGVVPIPPHDFEVTFRAFRFQTYFSEPCILTALLKLREELLDTESRRIFAIPMKKIATLDEFEQIQKNEIEKLTKHLQEVWVKKIVAHIKTSLKNVGKGWLNIYESKREIYDMSKLKRFITSVRFMMEDTLRFMTEDSISEFVKFIALMCSYDVDVQSVSEVDVKELNSQEDDPARLPLFAVEILYKDDIFKFSTEPQDFVDVILRLFDQAVNEMRQIPQVEPYVMDQFFWSDIRSLTAVHMRHDHIADWRRRIEETLTAALGPLNQYLSLYNEFDDLMKRNITEYAKNFNSEEHSVEEIRKEILAHRKQKKDILKRIPQRMNLGTFAVDCQTVRNALAKKCQQTADLILDLVSKNGKKMSLDVVNGFVKISRELNKPPQNIEQLTKTREFQASLHLRTEELTTTLADMRQVYDLLETFKKPLSDEEFKQKCAALAWPKKLLEQNEKIDVHLNKEKDRFRERMLIDQDQFQKDLDSIDRVVSSFAKHNDLSRVGEVAHEVKILQKQIKEYQDRAKDFNSKEILFGMDISEYKQLINIVKNFTPFANLWLTANDWINWQNAWLNDPFETIVASEIDTQAKKAKSTIAKCVKQFAQMPTILAIASEMRDNISDFEPKLPLIMSLRNPGVRDRHWKQMSEAIGIDLVPDETIKTLQDVFDLNLMEHLEKIQKVSDFAAQEYTIEKALTTMKKAWENTEFDVKPYRETGTCVLKLSDELQQQLDDHIALTQTLGFSNFKKHFESEIMAWDTQLNLISEIVEEWINCQREWMALEPIFSAPEMIKQLPGLHKKFKTVDTKYRKAMESVMANPGVLAFCSSNKILKLFQDCNGLLSSIQKGLNNYLETKRKQFARLYFLADDELLIILAQAQEPRYIQPYLKKCFANIEKVTFTDSNDITAMHSKGGENVAFPEPVHASGSVEIWLEQVESMMRRSVKQALSDSILDFTDLPRNEWVLRWPGQVIICASQIFWTKRCEDALREGGLEGLKTYQNVLNTELRELTSLMNTNITKLERNKLGALITIDVHALAVIDEMVERMVDSPTDFKWVSQMRYYWEEDSCVVKQVEASFDYGYEYLGNDGRLVITPLTDRIYLTLTGALHLSLGGAPAGPAGTGKTETVKDLAKALAKQCVVFNCQEGLDEFAMGKFFKGLIMAGAWACFDEFNRIDVEVLSVVAQQITTLQEAVRAGLSECEFENTTVRVDPTYAVFITMNPGYAGRTELPDNLKALFRPVACMVPDYALIAEIRLFSFGFLKAKPLSQKMVATFRLSSEQLSSQDHYDFGMRALNTVIAAAGLLKREDPTLDEEILLLRALRDSNLPKFLPNDVILFDGIISDLFPGTKIPEIDYGALIKQIEESCKFFSLQATDVFMKKCIQLYETTILRHGLMLVGLTMGGKTRNHQVLAHALSKLSKIDNEKYKVVKTTVINPKSVTMAQLYGEYDRNTREWKDGVLANEFRSFVHDTSDTRKWLIFDGPVDALWIESMNTVLDDNRKLCLVSGAIIEMTAEMNIIFEVQDLAVASPATVSRCGMVYMEPSATVPIGSLVASWIEQIGKICKPLVAHSDKIQQMLTDIMIPLIEQVNTDSHMEQYARAVPNNLATSCFNLLDSLFAPYNINKEAALMAGQSEEEVEKKLSKVPYLVEPLTLFALIWSTGASLTDKSRHIFDSKIREFMTTFKIQEDFPREGLVFDYQFDQESIRWVHWLDTQPEFKLDPELAFNNIVVPTTDTIRYNFLLETLMTNHKHVLCVGPTGTGKTLTISKKIMRDMPKNFMPLFIFFSARTDANATQDIIDGKLEKHRKGTYGPPLGSDYIIFVDDLNMPQLEEYGAQPPIELLRQWMDHGGWYEYNTERLNFRKVVKVQFAAAMGPPGGGRNPVTDRFLRHFNFISFPEMDDKVVFKIFDTILGTWVNNKLPESIHSMTKTVVQASIDLYNKVRETMLPTPSKSHYTFNLRDLAKIFSGVLSSNPKALQTENDVLRLWIHESMRVFSDRLVDDHDRITFRDMLKSYLQKDFDAQWDKIVDPSKRLIYGDFMQGSGEGEYEEIKDMKDLVRVMNEQLDYYNDAAELPMNLVMFLDAIEHVARISRIIRQPGGNALLLGVGGSGRQSLTRLAAFMGEFKIFQVEISKSFDEKEWKDFLKQVMLESGKNNLPSVFLFTDTQIIKESFLEDINNLLNAGEIPNLMEPADLDEIYQEMKPLCAVERLPATPSSWYARFVKRVKENLHIVLAMSPTTDIFRTRLRMFPSLVTCCTIDWFSEWPPEGLFSVAESKLDELSNEEEVKHKIIEACVYIHESVASISRTYFTQEGRSNHVTPTSYLELLQTFTTLLKDNNTKLKEDKKKFELGLNTLGKTEVEVEALQRMLEEKQPVLKKTQEDIQVNMKKIEVDKAAAEETRVSVEREEAAASAKARECQAIKDKCDADLQEALPLLDAALQSLKNLKVDNIKEVSTYKNPTKGVKLTMEAVMVMFGKKPAKSTKDGKSVTDYWEPAKLLLGKAKELRNEMIDFDKDSLTKNKIDRISKFMDNPDFTPKEISRASKACTAMCEWVRAMYNYYHVNLKVKPLREDLAKAEKELKVVEKSLAIAQKKLSDINSKIQQLEDENQKAIDKSQELAEEVELCTIKLNRANRLISGLAGEKIRWIQTLEDYSKQEKNIIGDMIIASGGVAYLGPFTAPFRKQLNNLWIKKLEELSLSYTVGYGVSNLVEGLAIRNWNAFGLPSDSLSIENAIIMSKARRWPLMIDPQLQANQWIKNMEKENQLKVVTLNQSDYLRTIVNAVQFGNPVLLENIGEELDPAIEPILLKQTFVQNGATYIRIGEDAVQYNPSFRFYMTTKLRNPQYTPEASVRVTLLNFFITPKGLEDQLLGTVVKLETPELEQMKNDLMKQNVKMRNDLANIQNNILKMINESGDEDILANEALINALEESKVASESIIEKVAQAETTEREIDVTRNKYKPVAVRGSILFFCISDMTNVDPMYQYSLQWFIKLFTLGIENAEEDEVLENRLKNLIDYFTYSLYHNVCQSLFAKHKLMFSFMLTIRILMGQDLINPVEWRFFLTGTTPENPESMAKPDASWMTEKMWKEVLFLSTIDAFKELPSKISNNVAEWHAYFDTTNVHQVPIPEYGDMIDSLQKLLVMRALRPDKVTDAIVDYVTEKLGKKFVMPPRFDLARSFKDSSNETPLVMILSAGADPKTEMNKFAESMRIKRFASISLGRGTEKKATQAIKDAIQEGSWVLLQNCHLATSFMPALESIVEEFSPDNHRDFRLWLTSMPTPKFPVSVLQNSVKMTLEPPKGLQANLMGSFDALDDNSMTHESKPMEFKKLLFSLCFLHAIVQERRKFGPLGWNIPYEFTNGDLNICIQQLHLFLEKYDSVPYEVIQFLTGQINYGGRVTDDWDRRTLMNFVHKYITEDVLSDGYKFSKRDEYFSIPAGDHKDYVKYIESLPLYTHPETFGLHENAEITYNITELVDTTDTILSMQPKGSGNANKDEIIKNKAEEFLRLVPKPFDIHAIQKRYPTMYEECMNTVLVQEVIRYNKLIKTIRRSLRELLKAIEGLVVMSESLERMNDSMFNNQVPDMWSAVAFPSLMPLGDWIVDLVARCKFIKEWADNGHPKVFWISGFFFPQGFLTGALQNYARKYTVAIDRVKWDFEVLDEMSPDEVPNAPEDGVYISGLYLEGADWDRERKLLTESKPKQLFTKMPIIWLKPVVDRKKPETGIYDCPSYKTLQRAGQLSTTGHSTNYILCIELPSDQPQEVYIGKGVAMISALRFATV
mmetsp:Transcript_7015/g.26224  ORF Transcript_7015/g.26224 Transcript_7015/m.26224 type:complete len:4128 (-) Transcript_7015:64-12447(-)